MKQKRPAFRTMWHHFNAVNQPVPAVGKVIGGKVQQNIELELKTPGAGFANACAIRICYCFHHSSMVVPRGPWDTVSGGDKKLYIYRVNDLRKFLEASFGKPDIVVQQATMRDFAHVKGIILFTQHWGNATGHATLWDGKTCSDRCYFPGAMKVEIWLLK